MADLGLLPGPLDDRVLDNFPNALLVAAGDKHALALEVDGCDVSTPGGAAFGSRVYDWSGCDQDAGVEGCFIQSMDGPREITVTFGDSTTPVP